ncbi:disulfide bond formation protein B [Klebsiella pneumoniae subsp. ozaenae]|uniref:Disulfide bond formation protein B n=1 Tax=Klebsiella pneumoniae subsp. ozaenae TaxID=574 RepID=A0A378BFH8_KLEPO|nr:disulfide bond formation protein B [Klebsiella pneumoniae subsp. ozaenae]
MLQYLNQCSRGRGAWLLMALTAFILRTCRAVVPARDAAAAVCHVYLRTLRAVRHHGRGTGWGAIAPKTPLALCRHGNLVVQRDTRTTAGVGAYDDPAAPFHRSRPAISPPASQPLACRWINGCRQVFVASGDCSVRQWQFLSLEMPQWLVGIFAAYLAGRYSGDRCSAFQSEKTRSVLVVKPRRVQPTMKTPCGAFFYASCASLNRFMSMVDHSCQKVHIKYIF